MLKRNIFVIIATIFFILSIITFLYSNKSPSVKKLSIKETLTPTLIISPNVVIEEKNLHPTIAIPTQIIIPTNIPNTPTSQPTNIPPPPPTDQPQKDLISLEINTPAGNNRFSLDYKEGSDPCSILRDVKNIGAIKSLTIIHYDAPLNSDYVKEINGYSDSWNFGIDGSKKPSGCSNYKLNKNSTVSWTFN